MKLKNKFFLLGLVISFLVFFSACDKNNDSNVNAQALSNFDQVNVVGNNTTHSPMRVDPNFVNAWGMSFASGVTGPPWISSAGTGTSVIYDAMTGADIRAAVTIPSATASTGGVPTGQVFNTSTGFRLANGLPARFIFAGAGGVIAAWNTANAAERKVTAGAGNAFLGITMATDGTTPFLYAANFAAAKINVYDTSWNAVSKPFTDPGIPAGYAPFNIQNIDNQLYVMYAKVDATTHEEEKGPGLGYVDIYNPDGSLVKRFISNGPLNAPWGIAKAPAAFWGPANQMPSAIVVGNFGDGHINAFDASTGKSLGQLSLHGTPLEIEGLWSLSFAPATATSLNPNWLFFAAGPNDEQDGLFGYIKK